jgi:hypothetical protein
MIPSPVSTLIATAHIAATEDSVNRVEKCRQHEEVQIAWRGVEKSESVEKRLSGEVQTA